MLAKTNGRLWLAASKSRAVVGSSLAMPPLKSNSHRAINCKHCSRFREHSLKCDNRHSQCQNVIVLAINLSCANPTNAKSCTRRFVSSAMQCSSSSPRGQNAAQTKKRIVSWMVQNLYMKAQKSSTTTASNLRAILAQSMRNAA